MSTKYVIERGHTKILVYKCERETSGFAWLQLRFSGGTFKIKKANQVFDTWAEAHVELMNRAEAQLTASRLSLQHAQGFAGNVRGMKPPQEKGVQP